MHGFKHLLTIFFLITSVISYTINPPPSRTFTVQAYESAQPETTLTGYYLNADDGVFYLTKDAPKTKPILSVDHEGKAFLVLNPHSLTLIPHSSSHSASAHRLQQIFTNTQQSTGAKIFLDTTDGHLGYTAPSTPPGAIFSYFLHAGAGTKVFVGNASNPQEPPAVFQWIGVQNIEWFACEVVKGKGQYKLFKTLTNTVPDLTGCAAVELAALDYNK